jgi:hypothetical protein
VNTSCGRALESVIGSDMVEEDKGRYWGLRKDVTVKTDGDATMCPDVIKLLPGCRVQFA